MSQVISFTVERRVPRTHALVGQGVEGEYYTVKSGRAGQRLHYRWLVSGKAELVSGSSARAAIAAKEAAVKEAATKTAKTAKVAKTAKRKSAKPQQAAKRKSPVERHLHGECGCRYGAQYNCRAVKLGLAARSDFAKDA